MSGVPAAPGSGPAGDAGAQPGADPAAAATDVLQRNWTGSHTVPATGLYPHQWSWDSGFIAMGLRHTDARRAQVELESLTEAQWDDGRLPQIVYDSARDDGYAPGASFWRSRDLPGTPDVPTAGLVQPPLHAWAAWQVHLTDPALSAERGFLARLYPRLVAWHDYLARARDRGGRGLAAVVHPWESGMDNSPLWDEALARVPDTPRHQVHRPDLQHADPSERPTTKEYHRYFWLAEHYRDHGCDDAGTDHPFLMEDPAVNALWALSELALGEIAAAVGEPAEPHTRRARRITESLQDLFDADLGLYVARDLVTGELVRKATVSGLVPALLPDGRHTEQLVATLLGPRFLGSGAVMVPSYDTTAPDLDRSLYWRGPAWFNTTWLMVGALRRHGHPDVAERLEAAMCRLAVEHDFPEYVDPWDGTPHGTRSFSWTAAVVLDVCAGAHRRHGLDEVRGA